MDKEMDERPRTVVKIQEGKRKTRPKLRYSCFMWLINSNHIVDSPEDEEVWREKFKTFIQEFAQNIDMSFSIEDPDNPDAKFNNFWFEDTEIQAVIELGASNRIHAHIYVELHHRTKIQCSSEPHLRVKRLASKILGVEGPFVEKKVFGSRRKNIEEYLKKEIHI